MRIFTLAGIPVTITLWYALMLATMLQMGDLETGVLWAACVTFSILIHEFGHGLMARHFGLRPSIVLHGFGGLTQHARAQRDRDDVFIIAAGPGVGLVFGFTLIAAVALWQSVDPEALANPRLAYLYDALVFVNVFWSFVNLLPLWPLDGGQLFRLLMLRLAAPARAERITHMTGLVLGSLAALAAAGLMHSMWGALLALMCAVNNYQRLKAPSASGPIRSQHRFGHELLDQAAAALAAGDAREAARLCHQIRADVRIDASKAGTLWVILGLATLRLGEYEDAKDYLARAPRSPDVLRAEAELALLTKDRALAGKVLADGAPAEHSEALRALAQ